jgi:hypothetical protein
VRTGKLDGWSLVAGPLKSDEHPDWHHAALRGCERLAPLRFGEDFFLSQFTDRPLCWSSRSAAGLKRDYQAQVFGLRFLRPADECLSRLPPGAHRLVPEAQLADYRDDVLSAVLAALARSAAVWEAGAVPPRSSPSTERTSRPASPRKVVRTPPPKAVVRPVFKPQPAPGDKWTPAVIARMGVDQDTAIARDLGCSISAVSQERNKRGIARAPAAALQPRAWTRIEDKLLGTMSDVELAAELNISKASVERRRVELGVAAHGAGVQMDPSELTGARYVADHRAGMAVADIAHKHGVSRSTVAKAMKRYRAREQAERVLPLSRR